MFIKKTASSITVIVMATFKIKDKVNLTSVKSLSDDSTNQKDDVNKPLEKHRHLRQVQ